MSGAIMDISHGNFEAMRAYQHKLLNQALTEGIRRNEEQFKIWTEYKKRHGKVIEALKTLPLEVSVNCMVPVGKRALMKGKLIHTNEVLACLGEGYFAKYSAAQAIALCDRRIQSADQTLKSLEKERNLYEMRQFIPLEYNAFGEEGADLVEHWEEKTLDDWRAEHRQREKEYRKKLSEIRKKEKTEIRTEEDLFQRLDELELEEDLADEMNRLEDERKKFYGEDLGEGEVYYESDEEEEEEEEESTDDEYAQEEIEKELNKLKEILASRTKNVESTESDITNATVQTEKEVPKSSSEETVLKVDGEVSCSSNDESLQISKSKSMSDVGNEEVQFKKRRRVSFMEPDSIRRDEDSKEMPTKSEDKELVESSKDNAEDSEEESEVIRIEFKHTDNDPTVPEFPENKINSPRDIQKMFSKPKSILKRSPNDVMPPRENPSLPTYSSSEEDEASDVVKPSAYNFVVKDICEKELAASKKNENPETKEEKRPASRFKMQRSTLKK